MTESLGISLAIVNHDGARHLHASLPAVVALAADFDEILLLDNASTDDSVAVFQRFVPGGRVVRLAENRSPGMARNAGLEAARSPFVLFMDNDVVLAPDCPRLLAEALAGDSAALLATPRVLYAREPERIQYDGADCHFLGHMILRNEDTPVAQSAVHAPNMGSFVSACFMFARERWHEPELFDPSFAFYYEDHDLGLRARRAGLALRAVPAATVRHGEGTPGLSLRPGGSYGPKRVRTLISGRWQTLLKSFSVRTLSLLAPCLVGYEVLQLVGVLKKGWGREWCAAVGDVVRAAPGLVRKRREIQRSRRVADGALLQGGRLPFKPELPRSTLERVAIRVFEALCAGWWRVAGPLL